MEDDEQDGLEPDDELVLPEEDELDQRWREKQKVDLPERTKSSPLLRRVILGDVKEKERAGSGGSEGGRGLVQRQIGMPGRTKDAAEEVEESVVPVSGGKPVEDELAGDLGEPVKVPEVRQREEGSEPVEKGLDDDRDLSEVFVKTAPAPGMAPQSVAKGEIRRRRRDSFDQESEWKGRSASPAWWLGGGVLCVLLVAASVFVMLRKGGFGESAPESDKPKTIESQTPYESLPIAEFVARSAELLPEVREILTEVESGAGGAELLRGGEASLGRLKEWRRRYPSPSPFREASLHEIHASGNDRFAYVVMTGERVDFSPLMAYFVKEDDRMLLDWEATEGYSEVLLDEVGGLADGEPRMMRGVIRLSNFYTDVYPEEEFRCYTLHHDDPGEWLWAYAERESEVDFRLISHMQVRDPLGRSGRVTVMLTKKREGSRPNQVEIEEMLFGGWIETPGEGGEGAREGGGGSK